MFTHNFDPVLFEIGFLTIRWYSLSYIFGILIGWWYGKKLINRLNLTDVKFDTKEFDDLITYLIIAIIVGGRAGYILFYNPVYYLSNPSEIVKVWEGGMSFHGALIGIIFATYIFSIKKRLKPFFLLDIIACVSPIGIFLGRIANFINGELVGKESSLPWSVIFPNYDNLPRHPSQLYEATLEGLVLFFLLNKLINKKNYKTGTCAYSFLIYYGIFRIISEYFRAPDAHLGLISNLFSMGTILSFCMIFAGLIIFYIIRIKNEN